MKSASLFKVTAAFEILTGLALLVLPATGVALLLGDGLGPTGIAVTRVLGIALCSLGLSAWESARLASRAALCAYNLGVAILLTAIGMESGNTGTLLWPAAILHIVIGAIMLYFIARSSPSSSNQG